MADKKTTAETAAATLDGTELIRGVQSAANVKITGAQLVALVQLQKLSTFAATSSAELAGVISDETGSGALVFANTPTLVTPVLGVATATSINKVTLTAPASGSTLTIANGKTLTVSNTLTLTGTDSSSVAFGAGGTVAYTGGTLAQFAATTSAQLAGVISDETGTGLLVFATNPTLTGATINAGALTFSGNFSAAAWTTNGARIKGASVSLTDTSSSGTVAAAYTNLQDGCTILASSSTTYTNYYGTYFTDPVASTNVTMTNKWALGADSLKVGTSNPLSVTSAGAVAAFSIVINGASIGSDSLAVTGSAAFSGKISVGSGTSTINQIQLGAAGYLIFKNGNSVFLNSPVDKYLLINNSGLTISTSFGVLANNNMQLGSAASGAPVNQILTIGEASRPATDSNVSGANGTIQSGLGTGTSAPSTLIFQTPITNGATTTAQIYRTQLTLGASIVLGNAALGTTATDGFIYIPTCAGTPTGVPTTNTGRVAMVYDTTNHQFWIYDGAWLQPKTPAAAAVVNWQ